MAGSAHAERVTRRDIIYNLQQPQIDDIFEAMQGLVIEGTIAETHDADVCFHDCFYFSTGNKVRTGPNPSAPTKKLISLLDAAIQGCATKPNLDNDDRLFCFCSSELIAETKKCASCLDEREGTLNFTNAANGWTDFCDTTMDKWAKLSTYSSIFTKTQTTALTMPTTRFSTGMFFTPYSASSTFPDIFTRGGQPTNPTASLPLSTLTSSSKSSSSATTTPVSESGVGIHPSSLSSSLGARIKPVPLGMYLTLLSILTLISSVASLVPFDSDSPLEVTNLAINLDMTEVEIYDAWMRMGEMLEASGKNEDTALIACKGVCFDWNLSAS
ncbi:hypothetical protein JCM3766R1_005776, partial [Sporobolomyces carnicolor]